MLSDPRDVDKILWKSIFRRWPSRWKISQVLNLAWSFALLAGLIYVLMQGSSGLLQQSIVINLPLLILSVAIGGTGLLLAVFIWRRILARYDVRLPLREDMRIYCYSALGFIIPGGIWTVVGRSIMYSRLGQNGVKVTVASIVESFVIGIAGLCLYVLLILLRPDLTFWQTPELGMGFAVIVLCAFHPSVFNRLLGWILSRSRQNIEAMSLNFGAVELMIWIGLESIVVLIGGIAMFVLLASVFTIPVDVVWRVIAGYAIASAIANLFFWLPGTPVLRDGAMFLALVPNLSLPTVLTFLALSRIWMIVSMLGIVFIIWLIIHRPHEGLSTHRG